MKSKNPILIVFLCAMSTGVFGQSFSMGVGVGWDPFSDAEKLSQGSAWAWSSTSSSECIDGFAYFDAGYIQVTIGYLGNGPSYTYAESDGSGFTSSEKHRNLYCGGWVYGAAMLEYPFRLKKLTLSPQLGVEYDYNLSFTDAGGNDLRVSMTEQGVSGLNRLWLKFGGAADVPFLSSFYARIAINAGFKFLNQDEKDYRDEIVQQYGYKVVLTRFRANIAVSIAYRL
jgi:hypothetical protein